MTSTSQTAQLAKLLGLVWSGLCEWDFVEFK